jgi:hypothetical protein
MLKENPLSTYLFVTVIRMEDMQYEKIDTGPLFTREEKVPCGACGREDIVASILLCSALFCSLLPVCCLLS